MKIKTLVRQALWISRKPVRLQYRMKRSQKPHRFRKDSEQDETEAAATTEAGQDAQSDYQDRDGKLQKDGSD